MQEPDYGGVRLVLIDGEHLRICAGEEQSCDVVPRRTRATSSPTASVNERVPLDDTRADLTPVNGLGLDPRTIVVRGDGFLLREWREADLAYLPGLFDDPDVARWTPLESPFGADSAVRYLAKAREQRAADRALHLAVTAGSDAPLGEVLLFVPPGEAIDPPELGYSIGLAARGRGLARRATALLVEFAVVELGLHTFGLEISPDNGASQAVATGLGAVRRPGSTTTVEGARGPVEFETWDLHR